MHRIATFALILAPILAGASDKASPLPVLSITFYAPAQKDSPVRIIGFRHDESEIQFLLSNASDKEVAAVLIGRVDIAPRGCTPEPPSDDYWPVKNVSAGGFKVAIGSHGNGVAARAGIFLIGTPPPSPGYPHWPKQAVEIARWAKAEYMQVQLGITGVLFKDGTAWPAQIAFLSGGFDPFNPSPDQTAAISSISHPGPFDAALVEAEAKECAAVGPVASALEPVKQIIFDRESAEASDGDETASATPRLHFTCSLEGSKAVCRMPLEQAHMAVQSQH